MRLSDLPIPRELSSLLESLGYVELYPPQEEAVKEGVLDGERILLTSPTASGKTLVALLASAKLVCERGGKAVYLTPLRALANEKYEEFKILEVLKKSDGSNVRVYISTGDYDSPSESLGSGDIIILTNEKFDSIIRHGASWLDDVKLYVADEVHLIGTPDRGPTLEAILAKILTLARDSQIIALSATISNAHEVATWLQAKLVDTEWRPVKLLEGIYRYGEIVFSDGMVHKVEPSNRGAAIVALDVVKDGGQSLIFAETRRMAVNLAIKASELTYRYLKGSEQKEVERLADEVLSIGEETELSRTLSQVIRKGSAFHHAGLSAQHRKLVEDSFRNGSIKVLTATPTLAAGVNLPARRVVINSIMRYDSEYGGRAPISVLEYKQMCGRAGRPRFDPVGETVLIASSYWDADELLETYIKASPEPVRSQLIQESALRTHLLATISTLPGIDDSELLELFSKTLLAVQYRPATIKAKLSKALNYLISHRLVDKRGRRYIATEFGKKVSLLYIDPATGVLFRDALMKLPKKRCPIGLLHLVVVSPDFSPKFLLRSKDWEEAER
ncbi:MAG: DEAD/DEAH box helicase, partial [Nitrososphaerota archaeon]